MSHQAGGLPSLGAPARMGGALPALAEHDFGYYDVTAGAAIHEHAHPNEEVWHVIEGKLEVTIDGETRVVGPGCVAIVRPNARHSVRALSEGRVIVTDHPRRHSIGGVATD